MNVTIHQAKTNLSKLINYALHGEDVIISRGKDPVVRLVPLNEALPDRRLDGAAGIIKHMPKDFNDEIEDFDDE